MSRTIRRKNVFNTGTYRSGERDFTHEDDAEHAKLNGGWRSYRKYDLNTGKYSGEIVWYFSEVSYGGSKSVPKKGKDFKKGWWTYHSDSIRFMSGCKGPSWFINEFVQRPYRRKAKRELHKYLRNEEYEVMIEDKPKRIYWD